MKKLLTVLAVYMSFYVFNYAQMHPDSLSVIVEEQAGRLNSLEERVAASETSLSKLTKIKVSGYVQAQFESLGKDMYGPTDPSGTFSIRRARVKFTYEAADGVKFVLQPDFSTGNVTLKDAYAVASIPALPFVSIWAGQFNRPVYEVEYSSGQREVLERSRVIRTLYPGEREIGAKLEVAPPDIPLKFQMAVINGNFTGKEAKDSDSRKDLMARLVYSFHYPGAGIGIDAGAHGYYGGMQAKNKYISGYDGVLDSSESNTGSYMDKKWLGGEMQVYIDLLGGMALKGEYIAGRNASAGDSHEKPNKMRNFNGYYAMLIKNIGTKNQFVARYDYYDPDTENSGVNAGSGVWYKTLTLAWQFYLNEFVRISLNYEMPENEISNTYTSDLKDNMLGVRIQARF